MAAVDLTAWDGPAAMSAASKSDDPAAAFAAICAGRRAGDKALEKTWALPHHKTPGAPPNAAGVRNCLARFTQTQGLVNSEEAKAHLEAHMKDIQAAEKSATPREMRMAHAKEIPGGSLRTRAFQSTMRGQLVQKDGRQLFHVEGYATVFNQGYEMWDMFGSYKEFVDSPALDKSLSQNPDVAFLVNHRGVTMARTQSRQGDPTLFLKKDTTGLDIDAFLNYERQDVRDLASAINDGLIDEMSFAFALNDGKWNDDYTEFHITEADINRGDVSAVNYGANPYTSIQARSADWLADLERMPEIVARAALDRIQKRLADLGPVADSQVPVIDDYREPDQIVVPIRQCEGGKSVKIWQMRLGKR